MLVDNVNCVLVGDCIEAMKALPEGGIDMIFADPPYNLQLGGDLFRPEGGRVDAVDDDWDKFDSFAAYDDFTRDWLEEARRILKDDGTIWVIGSYHNIYRVGALLQDADFWILNDIVWRKSTRCRTFGHALHQCARDADLVRQGREGALHLQLSRDEGAQRRSADALGLAAADLRGRRAGEGRRREKAHPTQKPEACCIRILLASRSPATVLDPFFGTGTTGAVARRLGRRWIGIERDPDYVKIARKRIASTLPLDESEDV